MFGGLCFMLNGNMVAGASKRGLLVRVGNEQHARSVARPDARPMEMSGRTMEGYVVIDPPPKEDRVLREWIELAIAFVQTLPPKPSKSGAHPRGRNVRCRTRRSHRTRRQRRPRSTARRRQCTAGRRRSLPPTGADRAYRGSGSCRAFGDRQPWHRPLTDPPVQQGGENTEPDRDPPHQAVIAPQVVEPGGAPAAKEAAQLVRSATTRGSLFFTSKPRVSSVSTKPTCRVST